MAETIDPGELRRAHRSELNPVTFLERSVLVYPDKVAVVHEGRRYTYREFGERVNRLASALRAAGLRNGDRVAFICPNIPALLEAHYGVPAAGGVLVALNYRLSAQDIGFILQHSGARFVFVDHEFGDLADGARVERAVRVDDTGDPGDPYEAFLAEGSADPVASELGNEDDPISINYTSGTTGQPKGAVYHYRGAYLNALGEVIETRLTPESVYLWTLPMFHCNGWCFTWAVTAVGGRHVCLRKLDPGRVWELIDSAQTNVCASHSSHCPGKAPAIAVEHRQCPQINTVTVQSRLDDFGERVEVGTPISVHDSFGIASSTRGIINRNRFFLIL